MDQSTAYLSTNWASSNSSRLEAAGFNNWGTVRASVENMKTVQAHDQLFAKLDVAPTQSVVRRPRITHDAVPDAWQILYALDEGSLEDDLVEAIVTAKLAARL